MAFTAYPVAYPFVWSNGQLSVRQPCRSAGYPHQTRARTLLRHNAAAFSPGVDPRNLAVATLALLRRTSRCLSDLFGVIRSGELGKGGFPVVQSNICLPSPTYSSTTVPNGGIGEVLK